MKKTLKKMKNVYGWINFAKFVLLITKWTIGKVILILGGAIYMPLDSFTCHTIIGGSIAAIGATMLAIEVYQDFKERTIPIMEAVSLVESYLKRKNVELRYDMSDACFWDRDSFYSIYGDRTRFIFLIFEACKEGKLDLFGKQVNDNQGRPRFVDLALEKKELVQWLKILAVNLGNQQIIYPL